MHWSSSSLSKEDPTDTPDQLPRVLSNTPLYSFDKPGDAAVPGSNHLLVALIWRPIILQTFGLGVLNRLRDGICRHGHQRVL
jgi:hypothetical protein